MIFASDLDQTLIYSENFLKELSAEQLAGIRLIETKGETPISYMTENAIALLKQLNNELLFVPVTTRSIEQYTRISLFANEIRPRHAIVSNGGNIITNGQRDMEWFHIVKSNIQSNCMPVDDLRKKFEEVSDASWVISAREVDDLFYYAIVERANYPQEEMNSFKDWVNANGWKMTLHGRKLYFTPNCLEKWSAVKYLADREGKSTYITAGDSSLDLDMLERSHYAISPAHGEVFVAKCDDASCKILFTRERGIYSAEELLRMVAAFVKESTSV